MKNLKNTLPISVMAVMLTFTACKKEKDPIEPQIPTPPTTTFEMKEFFTDNEDAITQTFTKNASSYIYFNGIKGVNIQIGPNSFETMSGADVTGNVELELVEIVDKETMLLLNKSTNGQKSDGTISTLISGGMIKLNATQNGNQLKFKSGKSYKAIVSSDLTGGFDADMNKFDGKVNPETNGIIWENEDSTGIVKVRDTIGGSSGIQYSWTDSSFGWTNIDKFYSDPRPKTTIQVQLPLGYDDKNSSVYLSYDGEPTALANFDIYNNSTNLFTEHYGLIPIGLDVHFVIVAEKNGQLYSEIVGKTIVNNHLEVISSLTPTTKAQLTADVIGLP